MSERTLALTPGTGSTAARAGDAAASLLPLQVDGLCFAAGGKQIIDRMDLRLPPDGATVVMGPNGAGKSVLLRLLHGLLEPAAGTILWNGKPPRADVRRRQALVFQRPVLLRRTVLANLLFAIGLRAITGARAEDKARGALAMAGLEHLANQPAKVLSGGEQQRLAIARALMLEPEVLLLDEPAASLDPASVLAIEQLIMTARGRGTKVVLVTHDIAHARRLGDDIIFLHHGRIREAAPAARFFEQPQSDEAKAYLDGRILL